MICTVVVTILVSKYEYIKRENNYKSYGKAETYDSQSYVSLISTYCDQIALPESIRVQFGKEIKEAIDRNGGEFCLSDTIDLYLAIKP